MQLPHYRVQGIIAVNCENRTTSANKNLRRAQRFSNVNSQMRGLTWESLNYRTINYFKNHTWAWFLIYVIRKHVRDANTFRYKEIIIYIKGATNFDLLRHCEYVGENAVSIHTNARTHTHIHTHVYIYIYLSSVVCVALLSVSIPH
jgi:hypothetical protein